MQIVITLKDTTYKAITTLNTISEHLQAEVVRAIKNGKPLGDYVFPFDYKNDKTEVDQ